MREKQKIKDGGGVDAEGKGSRAQGGKSWRGGNRRGEDARKATRWDRSSLALKLLCLAVFYIFLGRKNKVNLTLVTEIELLHQDEAEHATNCHLYPPFAHNDETVSRSKVLHPKVCHGSPLPHTVGACEIGVPKVWSLKWGWGHREQLYFLFWTLVHLQNKGSK